MKIYVTGARGFMGRNFMELARERRSEWELVPSIANMTMPYDLTQDVWKAHPDLILNFASKVGPKDSFTYPEAHLAVNLQGTLNLIHAAQYAGVKYFMQISSVEVYGTCQDAGEDAPLHPESPYARTKAAADLAVLSAPGIGGIIIRPGIAYGSYDRANRMIPMFIGNALRGHRLPIFGNGHQVRNWTYVDDIMDGIILAIEDGIPGEIYNLSDNVVHSKLEIARMILKYFDADLDRVDFVPDHSGHAEIQTMNCERAIKTLGWTGRTPFKFGLEMTIKDMKAEFEANK